MVAINKNKALFALLRSAVRGDKLEKTDVCKSEELQRLYKLSKRHSVAHLLALGLDKNGFPLDKELGDEMLRAIYSYEKLNNEYVKVCENFEGAGISFIPLKGSVLCEYYPEPWMRTSCDIDILVHESDVDKAAELLAVNHGYTIKGKGSHDVSLISQSKIRIELHYDLVEEGLVNKSSKVLKSVWKYAKPRESYKYWFEMPDDMFYFYHVAHMAKHFKHGGCGIRPFIDLWLLDNTYGADQNKRDVLLKQGELLKFAEAAILLSQIWLDDAEHTEVTKQMEKYILCGGVYGNPKNRIAVQQQKNGGRFKYAMSKIFVPYDVIKYHYPVLQKHRCLTPIMEVCRWGKLIFCGKVKSSVQELKCNQDISKTKAESTRMLLENIGL